LFFDFSPLANELVQEVPSLAIWIHFQEQGDFPDLALVVDGVEMSEVDLGVVVFTFLCVLTGNSNFCMRQEPPIRKAFTVVQSWKSAT
jgi:hypothetical protein